MEITIRENSYVEIHENARIFTKRLANSSAACLRDAPAAALRSRSARCAAPRLAVAARTTAACPAVDSSKSERAYAATVPPERCANMREPCEYLGRPRTRSKVRSILDCTRCERRLFGVRETTQST